MFGWFAETCGDDMRKTMPLQALLALSLMVPLGLPRAADASANHGVRGDNGDGGGRGEVLAQADAADATTQDPFSTVTYDVSCYDKSPTPPGCDYLKDGATK